MSPLSDLLDERVTPTRQCWDVDFPADTQHPAPAIAMTCSEGGMAAVILPVAGSEMLHLEVHMFVDGNYTEPEVRWTKDTVGVMEVTLRRGQL